MNESGPRTRWIIIGTVRANSALFSYGGGRWGYWVNWRGRPVWCQNHEFMSFTGIEMEVRCRLRLARLEPVALACRLADGRREYQPLWVEVQRKEN